MSIGYACLSVGVPNTKFKTCIQANATDENLTRIIANNLKSLSNLIDYNIENEIKLFRISSDLIPFASSPVNKLDWQYLFASELTAIGNKIIAGNMRVSMHPGQYTVLNSPKDDVVGRAVADLEYHTVLLDAMGLCKNHKIVLHIGGVYGEKSVATERFVNNFFNLDANIKERLVIENDDKSYHVGDVLRISETLRIPVIYDNLHNRLNPDDSAKDDAYWVSLCKKTWNTDDGLQKIHYSQQNESKRAGSHSETINVNEFIAFYNSVQGEGIDIMLEVKDKNLSAVKCVNCLSPFKVINKLEKEWSKYKYSVLEKSKQGYDEIRQLLKNKNDYPAVEFYTVIEHAMLKEESPGNALNAALHVWGYFKETAQEKEKVDFLTLSSAYQNGTATLAQTKQFLFRLAEKYNQKYLLDSYYFDL